MLVMRLCVVLQQQRPRFASVERSREISGPTQHWSCKLRVRQAPVIAGRARSGRATGPTSAGRRQGQWLPG